MREALYYEKLGDKSVRCHLCPHKCLIRENKLGLCRGRENQGGTLYSKVYGQMASGLQMDPIEKKPLYHFYPGSQILSVAPNACNLACKFCQNWSISQQEVKTRPITPEQLVLAAERGRSIGIAYTYTEPFTWYEFLLEVAPLARERGLKNVMVTNGYYEVEPFLKLLPYIDAFNIDLKSIEDSFYRQYCGATLAPVLETIKLASQEAHVEITNLVIPTLNDSEEQVTKLIDWVATELGRDVPLHFSRYLPSYKLDLPATPIERLFAIRTQAIAKLNYVYLGNVGFSDAAVKADTTFCPHCQRPLIIRAGYHIEALHCHNGYCDHCSSEVAIIQ